MLYKRKLAIIKGLMEGESDKQIAERRLKIRYRAGCMYPYWYALNVEYGLPPRKFNRIKLAVAIHTAGDCPCTQCVESNMSKPPAYMRRWTYLAKRYDRRNQRLHNQVQANIPAHVSLSTAT